MACIISLAGKGGTGKTTMAGLLVRLIKEKKLGSILAVDADPNSNLAELLGISLNNTIGGIINEIARHPELIPAGTSKDRYIDYRVHTAISEGDGFDVLSMGRPEGPGCYCYVNNVLRNVIGNLLKEYQYVIIDNEAGLEHLSRRTTRASDILIVVSNPSVIGIRAAGRIVSLARELEINIKKTFLLINGLRQADPTDLTTIETLDIDFLGVIPFDRDIEKATLKGISLFNLSKESLALSALGKLGERIWQMSTC